MKKISSILVSILCTTVLFAQNNDNPISGKKKITAKGYEEFDKDLSEIELPYDPKFWSNFSLPPDTNFYKKIKRELESNYGVPLETQFKYVN